MTEQEINNLIDSKIGKTKMSQLPEATQTSGLYSIGYTGNQSVKYKSNLLQGDPLTVRKTYQTEALALADKNPIDPTTSLPLTVGQFVSIVDDGEKNGIYRIGSISGNGTMSLELQGKLGDLSYKANHGYESNPKTLKEVDDNSAKLKSELDGLKSRGLLEFETFIQSNGSEQSSTSSKTTDYIQCSGINKLRVVFPIWSSIGETTGLAFYNKSKEFMSFVPVLNAQDDYGFEEKIIEVPEDAFYFRTTYWNEIVVEEYNFPDFYVYADNLLLELSDINNRVESLNWDVKKIENNIKMEETKVLLDTPNKNMYISNLGGIGNSSVSEITDYVDCKNFNLLTILMQQSPQIEPIGWGLAFYDESKLFISFVKINYSGEDGIRGVEERTLDVPENAYYFRTTYWNDSIKTEWGFEDLYYVASEPINKKVDRIEKSMSISTSISITSEDLVLKGRYIAAGGTVENSSVSNTSNLIPCKDAHYVSLMFQTLDATSPFFGFAFYDESEQLIERISAELDPSRVRGGRERILKIPSNAHYLRCQYWNEEKRIEYDAPEFYLTIDDTGLLFEQIAEISSGLNPIYTQEDLTIKNRYIVYIDNGYLGIEASSTSSDSTGFLRCNNFSKLTLMQPVWGVSTTGLGFYNKDFELISYIRNKSGETNTSYETTIEVPENAYYFRTTYWNMETIEEHNLPEFYVIAGTLAENINELYSKVRTTSLGGSYTVSFTAEKIIVTNVATNGSITFDLIGSDTLSGNFTDNEVLKGGKLIRKVEDEFKVMNVTFDLMSDSAPLQIYTHTTYKVDTEIENDGIEGICSGDMGFLKDENVFVEGNPMIAGFTDKAKTKFALCADYGSMTPHYDKLEEVKYTDIDVVKGERKFAKLSVLKEESPLRLLNQPNGYNATFTFASHADSATVPITKAIFYGTDNEASPTYNTNGLLSYGIKGTMSVFAEGHTYTHAALDNASFKALIDDAYSKGIEIIPHTITYNPDTRADAERVLPFFKDNYNSRNWIDHYLRQDNPSIGHHSKGNDTESPHYIMDLMEQYGFEYSWCYIDTTPDGVVRNQLFEEHYQFRRDLLFKNKKLTFPDGTPMWQYKNTWKMFESIMGGEAYDEIEHIQNLIDTCNVWADHPYLTATYGQLWKKEGTETFIDPKFDSMLSFVKDKKEAGEIWNPTQSEYNDNLAKLMDISIVRSGVGQYKVFSKNEENVNCSFLLKNTFKDVFLNGVLAEAKVSGDNMIFWGDIKQGENTITVS